MANQVKNRRRMPSCLVFVVLFCLVANVGCSSEENTTQASVQTNNIYLEIVTDAQNLENRYQELPKKAEQWLQSKPVPQNVEERDEFMQVALIGAAAYWWADDQANAGKMATRAYGYSSNQAVRFLPDWDADRLLRTKTYATAQKYARMKDFVISCANRGAGDFANGNDAFIAKGQFADAVLFYQNAMKAGLENAQARRRCHLCLTATLFKAGNTAEADKAACEAWLLDPALELEFGDQATHEFLQASSEKFSKEFDK
jgi:hypothetical protein